MQEIQGKYTGAKIFSNNIEEGGDCIIPKPDFPLL